MLAQAMELIHSLNCGELQYDGSYLISGQDAKRIQDARNALFAEMQTAYETLQQYA
jgi:hypothetical protein